MRMIIIMCIKMNTLTSN